MGSKPHQNSFCEKAQVLSKKARITLERGNENREPCSQSSGGAGLRCQGPHNKPLADEPSGSNPDCEQDGDRADFPLFAGDAVLGMTGLFFGQGHGFRLGKR